MYGKHVFERRRNKSSFWDGGVRFWNLSFELQGLKFEAFGTLGHGLLHHRPDIYMYFCKRD